MKILFLDQFADLGGAQRCLLDLLPAVERAGWQAHAALPGDGPLPQRLRERRIPVHPLSLQNYSSGRKTILDGIHFLADLAPVAAEIRALAERLEASLLYVNGPRLMPAVGRAGAGLPVLFHLHNHLSARNGLALVASAVRKTNATVIAASRFLAEPLERRLGRPVRVVYGGVEGPGNERPPRVPGSAAPRIGLIARVAAQKRQREFVLAAAALAKDWPHAEFYLCGDVLFGDRNAQRYKDETLALAPSSVRFLGWREEVYDVLANLDLLVLPSAAEGGVPRVILEAFAARVPVLASASGAIPEVVVEGQNGFLLASATGPAIAQRLRELLASPDRLAAAADRAYRLWRDRFTAGRYRDEVWEVVEAAASPSNRRKSHAESSPTAAVDTSAAE